MKTTLYRTELSQLVRLAYPLILAQLAQNTLSFVDTLMVGSLGEEALAGMAIGSTTFHFVVFVLAGVIYAISPMVSHAVGAGEHDTVPQIVRQGFWVGGFFFIPAFLVFWISGPILRILGQNEEVIRMSGGYLRAISFGALPALLTVSLRGFLEGTSNTRPILIISFVAVLLNVFLNDALIFGRYGLPALGLVGTGVASSIVYWLIFFITVAYVWKTQFEQYPIFSEWHLPHAKTIQELLRVGIPICFTLGAEIGLFAATAFVMGVIDPQQLAAHQIAIQSASIAFMVPLGIALATCVRVGNFAGQEDLVAARVAGRVGMMFATLVMSLSAIAFFLFPETIIGMYFDTSNPDNGDVLRHATSFLKIAGLFQIFDGLQVASSNALRGLKETTAAMYFTLLAYWVIGAPCCLILAFAFKLQGIGLWYGLTIGLAAAAVTLTVRFHRCFTPQ